MVSIRTEFVIGTGYLATLQQSMKSYGMLLANIFPTIAIVLMFSGSAKVLVVGLEAGEVIESLVALRGGVRPPERTELSKWDPRQYVTDPSGKRLFEEVARHCKTLLSEKKLHPTCVALTLPGAVQGVGTLLRSSRLGVIHSVNVEDIFRDHHLPPAMLLRDVDCLATGERIATASRQTDTVLDHVYLFVDEGVGSSIFINGKPYRGAGHGGPIGRLIVEPDGDYNAQFRSRGPLEVFAARPWISWNIVNQFLTESGKRGGLGHSEFRNAVAAASKGDPRSLPYEIMKLGIDQHDPIASTVIDRAAHYLGIAINTIITLINPPEIILAGGVIEHLPAFTEAAQDYARRYSWEHAWNSTKIRTGTPGRCHQYMGAARLAYNVLKQ